MRVTPDQSSQPQGGDQSPAPQGGGQQGPSPAEQAVQMIQQGYAMLGKIIQSAQGQLPPEDLKLFQAAAQATDALLQSLTGPSQDQGQQAPERPSPGGPMAQNANSKSTPQGPQG